jgi:hypothetical protein
MVRQSAGQPYSQRRHADADQQLPRSPPGKDDDAAQQERAQPHRGDLMRPQLDVFFQVAEPRRAAKEPAPELSVGRRPGLERRQSGPVLLDALLQLNDRTAVEPGLGHCCYGVVPLSGRCWRPAPRLGGVTGRERCDAEAEPASAMMLVTVMTLFLLLSGVLSDGTQRQAGCSTAVQMAPGRSHGAWGRGAVDRAAVAVMCPRLLGAGCSWRCRSTRCRAGSERRKCDRRPRGRHRVRAFWCAARACLDAMALRTSLSGCGSWTRRSARTGMRSGSTPSRRTDGWECARIVRCLVEAGELPGGADE